MPAKNVIKQFVENGYYHVYNRGVEKRDIFQSNLDYRVFLHLLKFYLSPQIDDDHPLTSLTGFIPVRLRPLQPLETEVELLAYCLMPNHFHLLLKQSTATGITKLLRRLSTTYSMYFNRKNNRVGHLFQGVYKAAFVDREAYLLHLSRYIHLNPSDLTGMNPVNYPYSSYQYYLGQKSAQWIKPQFILNYFQTNQLLLPKNINSYQRFVEDYLETSKEDLGTLTLD
jgi:putative transposase